MLTLSVMCWRHSFLCNKKMSKNQKNQRKVNIDGENLHLFWTTGGISMKFLGKMWLMIISKVTKTRSSPSLSRRYIFWKATGGGRGQIDSPQSFKHQRLDIFASCFSKMKLLMLFIVSYYTFRCNIFVVKKHLRGSEIFSCNPTKRMGLAITTVLALQNIIAM